MEKRIQAYFEARSARESGPSGPVATDPDPLVRIRVVGQALYLDSVVLEVGDAACVPRQYGEELARAGLAEIIPQVERS